MPGPSPIPAQKAQKGGKAGRGRSSGAPMANDYIPRGDADEFPRPEGARMLPGTSVPGGRASCFLPPGGRSKQNRQDSSALRAERKTGGAFGFQGLQAPGNHRAPSGRRAAIGEDYRIIAPVTTAQTTWNTKYPAHVTAQAAASAAREGKDIARQGVEAAVRPLVRRLQASPSVDNTERAALGITVPDKEPSPVGPPTTRPDQRTQRTDGFMFDHDELHVKVT